MTKTRDSETQLVCPITSTHIASFQSRWHELGRMVGYKCEKCGEFSIDGMAQARLAQFDDAQREGLSLVIGEIWKTHRVAARLDSEAVDRLVDLAPGSPRTKELAEGFKNKRHGPRS